MQITSSRSWAAHLAAVLLTGIVLGSWQDSQTTGPTAVRTVTPGQIAESPDAFVGRKVRIRSAEVEDVRTARLFTLDEDEFGAAPDVMVLIPEPAVGTSVEDGERVTVIGTLREMHGAAFQRDYHWWDEGAFTPEIDMIGARPVVVAESVTTEKGVELVGTPVAANRGGVSSGTAGTTGTGAAPGSGDPRTLQLVARDYRFEPETLTAAPGEELRVELINKGSHRHDVEFHLDGSEAALPSPVPAGESDSLRMAAPSKPGKYVFYCPVGDHRSRGMEGTLIVERP